MKKGEKTKQLILSKSLELFAENGFSGSSVRNIAFSVGLRESAIYNHFKSKNELLSEIIRTYGENSTGLNLIDDELIEHINKPLQFFKIFSEKLLDNWSQENQIKFLKFVIKETGRKINGKKISVNFYIEELEKIWIMIFTEMIKHNFIKKGDPKIYADEFIAPLFFIRLKYLSDEKDIDYNSIKKRKDEHVEFFWNCIKR